MDRERLLPPAKTNPHCKACMLGQRICHSVRWARGGDGHGAGVIEAGWCFSKKEGQWYVQTGGTVHSQTSQIILTGHEGLGVGLHKGPRQTRQQWGYESKGKNGIYCQKQFSSPTPSQEKERAREKELHVESKTLLVGESFSKKGLVACVDYHFQPECLQRPLARCCGSHLFGGPPPSNSACKGWW